MSKPSIVTIVLIGICVVLYIPELLGININGYDINYWLCVAPSSFTRPWEFVTAIFVHGSPTHLLMNMISLYWLGTFIERSHGMGLYLLVFFVSGIAGNVAVALAGSAAVGASGAIFGMLGAAALLLFMLRSDPSARQSLTGLLVMLALNVLISFTPGISLEAHFGGLAAGVVVEALIIFVKRGQAKKRLRGGNAGDSSYTVSR